MEKNIKSFHFMPIPFDVSASKSYDWCGCGQSNQHPICDKTGDCDKCCRFEARLNETVMFCGCGDSKSPPLCDGSHVKKMMQILKDRRDAESRNQEEDC